MEKHGWTAATREDTEARGRLTFDRAPVMSWIADTEAFCTYFNGIWLEDTNRTQNIEKGWLEGIHPEDFQSCLDSYLAAFADRQPFQLEYRWHCGDGEYRWILNVGLPQPTKEGNFSGYVGSCIEIAERKNAEIASGIAWEETVGDRASAEPVRLESHPDRKVELQETRFFALAIDLLCVASQDGYFQHLNPAWEKTLGYTCEELLSKPFIQFVHPEDFATTLDEMQKLANGAPAISFENRYRCKDRSYKWLAWTAMSWPEEGSIYAIARDITLAKQVEEELRESEERLRATFDQAAVGITQIGLDCRFLKVNQKFGDIVGYTESELLGQRFQDITDLADLKTQIEYIRQLVCGEIETFSMAKRYVHKNDSSVWVNLAMSLVRESSGEPKYLIGVVQDISDRIALEKELSLRQARFDAFFTAAPAGLAIFDQQLRYVQINETLAEIDGLPAREHIGKSLHQIMGERSAILEPMYRQILKTNKAILNLEICLETPREPGIKRHWVGSYFPLPGEDGMPLGVGEVATEITERKWAEEALKASEAQLREQATQLQAAMKELQQTQSQLIQTEKMSSLGQLVAGVAHEINNPVSFIYGNVLYASEYIQNLLELLMLYQQHYPNPVAEIVDAAEEIDLDFLVEDLPKLLSSMKMGAERIRDIILSLRTFSRLDEAEMKPVDIHSGIDSTLMILGNRLKETAGYPVIQVVKEYGKLPEVECYAGQINQVFMNVLSNAIDVLEEYNERRSPEAIQANPSTITLRTEIVNRHEIDNNNCRDSSQLPITHYPLPITNHPYVLIRISDNGPGMTEEVRQRLFDPFFTTKAIGKGTGLGLSISYQIIVEKHKGSLRCNSAPGKGAEFIIEIPLQQSN